MDFSAWRESQKGHISIVLGTVLELSLLSLILVEAMAILESTSFTQISATQLQHLPKYIPGYI